MKKLIASLMIVLTPVIGNAAIITLSENHKFIGDENPFRIMWSDIENYGSVFISTAFDQEVYKLYDFGYVQSHFDGIDSSGELSNELQASWTYTADLVLNDFFGVNLPVICEEPYDRWCVPGLIRGYYRPDFEKFSGMQLTVDIPVYNFQEYLIITEEQASLVSNPEFVTYNAGRGYIYNQFQLDANDMLLFGMNDFTVTYTYNDSSAENPDVPEPASIALLGLALAGGLLARRRSQ